MRPIWLDQDTQTVKVIDQRRLPHELTILDLKSVEDTIEAIREMVVRGAPLIGITGAWGVYLAAVDAQKDAPLDGKLHEMGERLKGARPTAVNLAWTVDRTLSKVLEADSGEARVAAAAGEATAIADEEAENCRKIGNHGLAIVKEIVARHGGQVRAGNRPAGGAVLTVHLPVPG